jgi:GNAT superfamily N-acetyltransferase
MQVVSVRRPVLGDHEAWSRLYAGYAQFYKVQQTQEMRDRVWAWIHDPAHEVMGLVAEREGAVIGLAHFRQFSRPLAAKTAGFLDDLFVDPAARGSGAAHALIGAVAEEGRALGWSVVRWLTAEKNYRARAVYDTLATLTPWRVYDLDIDW